MLPGCLDVTCLGCDAGNEENNSPLCASNATFQVALLLCSDSKISKQEIFIRGRAEWEVHGVKHLKLSDLSKISKCLAKE
jgi:hypothetical protein